MDPSAWADCMRRGDFEAAWRLGDELLATASDVRTSTTTSIEVGSPSSKTGAPA